MTAALRHAAAALALIASAPATAIPVETFLAKADALQAKGMMAMFSSDVGVLKTEVLAATKAWRARIEAARAGHRPLPACPPPKVRIGVEDVLAMLRAVPPAERPTTSVHDALFAGLDRRFPCRP